MKFFGPNTAAPSVESVQKPFNNERLCKSKCRKSPACKSALYNTLNSTCHFLKWYPDGVMPSPGHNMYYKFCRKFSPSNTEVILSKAQGCKDFFWKPSKPCHVGIYWIALTEYSHISTHFPGFQSFWGFLHQIVLAKLATTSIRVNFPNPYTPGHILGNRSLSFVFIFDKISGFKHELAN